MAKQLDSAEKASNIFRSLVDAAIEHPIAFVFVALLIGFLLCCLPNSVFSQLVIQRTEKRKLDARVDGSRRKLTANRQNRRK